MPNHAVVIGIDDYPGLSPLKGPCNDATAFLDWVTAPGPGGIELENVHKLLSSEFAPAATASVAKPVPSQITDMFDAVLAGNGAGHIGDRLYVFVAGHGMSDVSRAESAALLAANASREAIKLHHVVVTDYIRYFRRTYRFKEIVLIMDCCLDASVLRPLDVTGIPPGNPHAKAPDVRMFLATATVWSKKSYEKEIAGTTRGIFSVALMDALEKAPAEGNRVTGKVVKNYIEQNIKSIAGDTTIEDPVIDGRFHESVIFYERNDSQAQRAASAFKVRIIVQNAQGGETVDLFDGQRHLIASKVVDSTFVEFDVGAGIFKTAIRGTNRNALIEVVADHEETI